MVSPPHATPLPVKRRAGPAPVEGVRPRPRFARSAPHLLVGIAACFILVGCQRDDPGRAQTAPAGAGPSTGSEEPASRGRTYQRTVVFIDTASDTTMYVPWDFESRSEPGGVQRVIRGWLGRGGQWALFMEDEWITGPSRAPWRILPRGAARLVMGQEDALQSITYREGLRDLSVNLGATVVEWRGQRGEIYRLLRGTARLSDIETEGLVLDVSTARVTEVEEPAEWALLRGGETLQLLIADPEGPGLYRAWARSDFQDLAWPDVEVQWAETRGFERARRDIPVLWRFESDDGELSGEFESVSSHLQALDGTGVILPALGVYEVEGTVTIGDTQTPVKGFLRHFQR